MAEARLWAGVFTTPARAAAARWAGAMKTWPAPWRPPLAAANSTLRRPNSRLSRAALTTPRWPLAHLSGGAAPTALFLEATAPLEMRLPLTADWEIRTPEITEPCAGGHLPTAGRWDTKPS